MVFPFLVITSYILHRDEFNAMKNEIAHPLLSQKQSLKNMLQRNQRVVLIHLLTILFVLFSLNFFQESKYRVIPVACILLFALSPPLMAWTIRHSLTEPFITLRKGFKRLSYIGSYTLLVCLTIFSISVLPVMGIGSFAFKEEEQMKTKARQFQLANGIEGRATYLDGYLARTKLRNNKEDSLYKIARKYAPLYGIYLLNDSLAMKNFDKPSVDNHSVPFY